MHISWSLAALTALQLSSSLATAKTTFSVPIFPRADTELSILSLQLSARQASDTTTSSIVPSRDTINATNAACIDRLSALNGLASSPTGMSVCYDVSSLDTATGDFISQIYLYQVSPATGNWTNIDPTSLNVNIAYIGANLTRSATAKITGNLNKRRLRTRDSHPVLVASEAFQGRVVIGWDPTDQAKQMSSLQPVVTLTALTSPSNLAINSTLSPTEAAFVTGPFASAASSAAAAAAASTTPFVLPGTTLQSQISPAGMIITGIWAILFIGVVGAGTIGRLRYRKAYRRRAAYSAWSKSGTYTTASTTVGGAGVKKTVVGYERRNVLG